MTFGLLQKQSPCSGMGVCFGGRGQRRVGSPEPSCAVAPSVGPSNSGSTETRVLSSLDSNTSNGIWHHVGLELKYAMPFSGGIWRTQCLCFRFP